MPFRSLAEPEDVAAIEAAFEHSWKVIESSDEMNPLQVSAQRERLAHITMRVRAEGKIPKTELASPATGQLFAGLLHSRCQS